jgi:7-carboxy-7-deazaguanine synthase
MYIGERQIFVRLAGCNLNCAFCDTNTALYREYEPEEVLGELEKYNGHFHSVSFTGGEPLLQSDFLKVLLTLTRSHGFRNYLETNGTLPEQMEALAPQVDIVSMDIKLPSSTGLKAFWQEHRRFLTACSQSVVFVKAVICDSTTENDVFESVKTIKETKPDVVLVLQPDSASRDQQTVSRIIESFKMLCHRQGIVACSIPQMHTIIGVK